MPSAQYYELSRVNALVENIKKSYLRGWEPETRINHFNTLIDALNDYIVGAKQNIERDPNLAPDYQKEWLDLKIIFGKAFDRLQIACDLSDELPKLPFQRKSLENKSPQVVPGTSSQGTQSTNQTPSGNNPDAYANADPLNLSPPPSPFLSATPVLRSRDTTPEPTPDPTPNNSDDELEMDVDRFFNTASKIVTTQFDGDPSKVRSFIDALTLLDRRVGEHMADAVAFVKTRLVGDARDLITTEETLGAIITTLQRGIKMPNSGEILQKLAATQLKGEPADFCKEVDQLASQLKRAYLHEAVGQATADTYVTREVTKILVANAPDQQTKNVMQAREFASAAAATAKYAELASENKKSLMHYNRFQPHSRRDYHRGGYHRGNYHRGGGRRNMSRGNGRSRNSGHSPRSRGNRGGNHSDRRYNDRTNFPIVLGDQSTPPAPHSPRDQ